MEDLRVYWTVTRYDVFDDPSTHRRGFAIRAWHSLNRTHKDWIFFPVGSARRRAEGDADMNITRMPLMSCWESSPIQGVSRQRCPEEYDRQYVPGECDGL